MRLLICAALVAFLPMALLATGAEARWKFMNIEGLEASDMDAMGAAGAALEGKAIGHEESWNNPETGNSGTIRLLKEDTCQGMPCQYRGNTITIGETKKTEELVFRRCKTPDGKWKLAPEE